MPVKLNGINYMGWSFHLEHYAKGKGLSRYPDGTVKEPTNEKDEKRKATSVQNNSKVESSHMDSKFITLSLHSFPTASEMWMHLRKLHHQTNKAREFFLDTELSKYYQGDKTVQEYFSGFLTLSTHWFLNLYLRICSPMQRILKKNPI